MSMQGRSLISPDDFSVAELNHVIAVARQMRRRPEAYAEIGRGRILATLFYEPSTRTKLSFESAMLRLGGSVLGFSDASTSSVSKGESIADTIRVLSSYADVAVMRHPREGAAKLAAEFAPIPVINGGDGGHQHPTQTLTDLLTIAELKGSLDGHTIAFCGDLKYGRTVHSLIKTMSRYQSKRFILIAPDELALPDPLMQYLRRHTGIELQQCRQLEDAIGEADILYMTRIQKERFASEADYLRLKDCYLLDAAKMRLAKSNLLVLHPLPRVNEIAYEVDNDPRAAYFQQAALGVFARMSLISLLLGLVPAEDSGPAALLQPGKVAGSASGHFRCSNARCITNSEDYVQPSFTLLDESTGEYSCDYCEATTRYPA